MSKRHSSIGIKQLIRYEWMEKTSSMLLAGMDEISIRKELNDYLLNHKGDGSEEQRSENTCKFAVSNLMKVWVSPEKDLLDFRDFALELLQKHPSQTIAIHWAMISAVYPFWFNVALHIGRLLNLQDKITHQQIINRLKEQYGDRQTVSRNAQFVIRSFIAWGILKDSDCTGNYERGSRINIDSGDVSFLLIESILYTIPDGKGSLKILTNSPALFSFQLPVISADYISKKTTRINIISHGIDEDFLELRI
ncbi:hypothetical protein [Methanolobus bombayensis]|uniref:hypothetical protein n=1 Tax=Methanolobus bombayensis TaxID=38023 RepID=UPI001AE10CFF|nr:hypothetical protein [Methanolobus bombayensis]MBP1908566.1 hypothetical protein [Methanolobus bombayensis]